MQLPEHLPLPSLAHRLVGQGAAVTVVHAPALLQTDAGVAEPSLQLAAVQVVPLPAKVQALVVLPSHCPLQGAVPLQAVRVPRGSPETATH